MSGKDTRLLQDIGTYMTCYRQEREGWYKPSCFEAGVSSRKSCMACRVLHRLAKRLEST